MSSIDFVNEQMDSSDDDVLEIAAYGTQAVCIKNEEETPAVFIKEESTIATEYEENVESNTGRHNLTDLLLVYTTRLDQMNTFDQIARHTSAEATDMIVCESKPRYKQMPVPIKPEPPSDSYMSSYSKLCSQVQQLNTIVKTETYLRNEKLMKMCKPLKIELVDYRTTNMTSLKKEIEYNAFLDYSSDEYAPSSYSSDESMPLSKSTSHLRISNRETSKDLPVTITVAIKDKTSQEADVYIIDTHFGVKNYYRTSMDECNKLQYLHQSKKLMVLEYCCWVNREKCISKFIKLYGFPKATHQISHFLRKPHNCLPRPCTCCCVFGSPMLKQPSNGEFTKYLNKKYFTEPSILLTNSNNIIEKARLLAYMPKVHDIKTPITHEESTDFLQCAVIIIKYERIIFGQTNLLGENYEIGNKGEIIDYVRPSVNRSINEEKHLYQKRNEETNENRIYFSYLICCWHHREDVMTQLRDTSKLSPNALRFMRTPHLCRSDKCECCCKPVPLINFTLENIAIHNNPILYRTQPLINFTLENIAINKDPTLYRTQQSKIMNNEYMKKIITNSDGHIYKTPIRSKLGDNIEIQNVKIAKNTENRITNSPKAPRKMNNCSANPKTTIKQSSVQENINSTIDSCFGQKPTPTNHKTTIKNSCYEKNLNPTIHKTTINKTQLQPNTSDNINLSSDGFADPRKSPTTLVTNVLDRFKDLKLSVNENGKLTAIINTLPGKLSTVEIKVLTDILLLAATQIEQLGITAQEFCNRVNASRAANGSISSPMPQFVPIYSNIINKTVINDSRAAENNASILPPKLQYVTKTVPPSQGSKTHPLNSSVPITRNKTPVCGIYQMMSNIGGQKNQHLVKAYRLHFKEKDIDDTHKKIQTLPKKHDMLPKISEIFSLTDNEPKTLKSTVCAPVAKRKKPQAAKPPPKKFRVVPLEKLPKQLQRPPRNSRNLQRFADSELELELNNFVNAVDIADKGNVPKSVKETVQILNPCLVSRDFVPVPDTSDAVVQQPENQILFQTNSHIAPLENTSGTLVKHIFAANNEIMPLQNSSGTDPGQFKMETDDQTPHFVTNSNITPIQNIRDTDVSQPNMVAVNNQVPFLDANNRVNLQIQNPSATDFLKPEMWAHKNEIPHFITNSDVTPIQNINDCLADSSTRLVIRAPAGPVPSENPLLYKMLASPSPSRQLAPLPLRSLSRPLRPAQVSVRPFIEAHRKNVYQNKRKNAPFNEESGPIKATQIEHNINPNVSNDIDLEKSITSTVMLKPVVFSQEEILNAVNNKQLFEDDEEDGIFGV